jgi:predicted nuclease with TOPRIM domain
MVHQLSFQTLVERYERVNGRVRDLVADKEKAADEAKVINARMDAMQIRMDYFDAELARVAAAPTNGVVENQYNMQL